MTVTEYLDRKGLEWKRRGDNAVYCCPWCGDTEWHGAINLTTGAWNCLRGSCGRKGNFWAFQQELGDKPEKLNDDGRFYQIRQVKKEYKKPNVALSDISQEALYYLYNRGFNDNDIKYFKLKSDGRYIAIPYFKGETLVGIKYRSIIEKKDMRTEKDSEPVLFNRDNITDKKRLIVCEGEYDAIALHHYNIEAVSVPNGVNGMTWVENEFEFLNSFKEIFICFDNDESGDKGAIELANRIGMERCWRVKFLCKDANECLIKNITPESMLDAIDGAEDMAPSTLVSTGHFRAKIHELFETPAQRFGVPTPWRKLTNILKGWRPGETTIWCGRNGSGKTTILNQVFLDLIKRDLPVAIYSGEGVTERLLQWAIIQHQGSDSLSRERRDQSINFMDGKLFIINFDSPGMLPAQKLFDDFKYAAMRYGVSHFIIDSLVKIEVEGQDEYRWQQKFMSDLCDFSKKWKSHIHLVAHPRKPGTMAGKDSDEPGKMDVKGTSALTDLAHNVVMLYRTGEKKKESYSRNNKKIADAELSVLKNREFGIEGYIAMTFDDASKRFLDVEFSMNERLNKIADGKAAAMGGQDE